MNPEFDIVILGGGLVGSSLACALDGRGYRIALVEGSLPRDTPPGFDERKLALAATSLNALDALGVSALLPEPPSPIRRIHVSRQGDFGAVRLAAADSGREAVGGVVSARELGLALERRLAALSELRLLRPQTLTGLAQHHDHIELQLQSGETTTRVGTRLRVHERRREEWSIQREHRGPDERARSQGNLALW